MAKQNARIDDWCQFGNALVGRISKHPRQDDFKKELQITSPLVKFDPLNNYAETLNTIYDLGTRNDNVYP